MTQRTRVYVVLVNWNCWADTLECLESVLRSDHREFRIIVVDNGSADDSVERIRAWAAGAEPFREPASPLAALVSPPVTKPVRVLDLPEAEARRTVPGGDSEPVILIRARQNLGFAGGCNVGMRHALAQEDCGYVWLLNNDTSVAPGAMGALVSRVHDDPEAGQCGARLVYYDDPGILQALGGARYNRWLATAHPVGGGTPADAPVDAADVERRMDYVIGASIFVRRDFLERVGLLEEGYFAYYEELDWAARSRGSHRLAYAHDAIVYHKEGRSMGSAGWERRSELADYYQLRNRLRYTWRWERAAMPTVMLGVLGAAVNRLRRRQPARALTALRVLVDPSTYRRAGGGRKPG